MVGFQKRGTGRIRHGLLREKRVRLRRRPDGSAFCTCAFFRSHAAKPVEIPRNRRGEEIREGYVRMTGNRRNMEPEFVNSPFFRKIGKYGTPANGHKSEAVRSLQAQRKKLQELRRSPEITRIRGEYKTGREPGLRSAVFFRGPPPRQPRFFAWSGRAGGRAQAPGLRRQSQGASRGGGGGGLAISHETSLTLNGDNGKYGRPAGWTTRGRKTGSGERRPGPRGGAPGSGDALAAGTGEETLWRAGPGGTFPGPGPVTSPLMTFPMKDSPPRPAEEETLPPEGTERAPETKHGELWRRNA